MANHINIKLRLMGIVTEALNMGEIDGDFAESLILKIDKLNKNQLIDIIKNLEKTFGVQTQESA